MVNTTDQVDNGSLVKEGESSLTRKLREAQNEALIDQKSDLEIAEKPEKAVNLLICDNTQTGLLQRDVACVSIVHGAKDVILVEDSQMPSIGLGQEELNNKIDHTVESETCIMETPEKADSCGDASETIKPDQFLFRLFSDEHCGLAASPGRSNETAGVQLSNCDYSPVETSHVTVVPDSCAVDFDHVTPSRKDVTSDDDSCLLTIAVETEPIAAVQMEAAVAMETEETNDILFSNSSSFEIADDAQSVMSASSMNLRISDVEFPDEGECHTPNIEPTMKVGLQSNDSLSEIKLIEKSEVQLTEKRSSGQFTESPDVSDQSIEVLNELPVTTTSTSEDEEHLPLAAFMKVTRLASLTPRKPMEGRQMTTADQKIPTGEQQLGADVAQPEERQLCQIRQQKPTDIEGIQQLSSQTQDLPSESQISMHLKESDLQPSLVELPSAQPLHAQTKEYEQDFANTSVLTESQEVCTEYRLAIDDVISPEPVVIVATSSDDDIPLGVLVRKSSCTLSNKSQTSSTVDADANPVLASPNEKQSTLVTKLRSRGRPKRSPYNLSSPGLTLRSRSVVRPDAHSIQILKNKRSGRRENRKLDSLCAGSVEHSKIQRKRNAGKKEVEEKSVDDVFMKNVTYEKKKDEEPKSDLEKHNKKDKWRNMDTDTGKEKESAEEKKNKDEMENEVNKESKESEKRDFDSQKEKVKDTRNKTDKAIEIEDDNEVENTYAMRQTEMEERPNKKDEEKFPSESRKLRNEMNDKNDACKTEVESNNNFTQICDPRSTKNCTSNKGIRIVISDDSAVTAVSGAKTVEMDDAVSNLPDTNQLFGSTFSGDDTNVTKTSATMASLISPVTTSNESPASVQKNRTSEIPSTPTSASAHYALSRGHLMLSRSKQLFAMPNSGKLKPAQGGTESPQSFFQSVSESARTGNVGTGNVGSPLVLPRHVFSPSASPSAGILRKKRLREESPAVDSPSPPHKLRRVCFSDKVDTIEIPNRYQQHRLLLPVTKDSPPLSGKLIKRQLEMTNTPPSSTSLGMISSKNLNLQKGSGDELSETKGPDLPKSDVVLEELYSMDCDSSETLQVLAMTPESQLNCSEPIFPELVNCTLPIDHILPKLTTTTWMTGLRQLLHAKNIKTIGNLSSLSELEVHNLPIVQPKVDNLRESLQAFARLHKMSPADGSTNKKNKIGAGASEQDFLTLLGDKDGSSCPESSALLRGSDTAEHSSGVEERVNKDSTLGDAETSIAVCAAEKDNISHISLTVQPLENKSLSPAAIGEDDVEDHQELLVSAPSVEPEAPEDEMVQKGEEQVCNIAEPDTEKQLHEICSSVVNQDISRELALRIMNVSLKMLFKCYQVLTAPPTAAENK